MKFTTASILAFACASALANSAPYEETAVCARDLYERGSGEGILESFEKRKGRGRGPSLSKSFASAAGNLGGIIASKAVLLALQEKMTPPTPPQVPQQQRRSLQTRVRRRRLANPGSFAGSLGPMRRKGKFKLLQYIILQSSRVKARNTLSKAVEERSSDPLFLLGLTTTRVNTTNCKIVVPLST